MYRFFVEDSQILQDEIVIRDADVNHIKNVLRMKPGETVLVSDGNDREYVCTLTDISDEEVHAKIENINGPTRELSIKVTLFQALPKGDKMETVIQKMVELGAFSIVPVSTKRCIVKLDEKKAEAKTKRWNAIAMSAAKQSKRGIIPQVLKPVTYKEALDMAKEMDMVLIPYEEAKNMEQTRDVISRIASGMEIGIFIGPEGGFAPEEVRQILEIGGYDITLGRRILRTETAGMALMSVLMFQNEE